MRKKHECKYCLCGVIPPQGENFPNEDSKPLTKFQMNFGDLKERIEVSVFNARLYLDTKESVVTSREINYCPMCGRYLRGNNNEAAI